MRRKKKKMRKEDTDFNQIKKNIEEMEMKNSDMELLAKHLDENTQGTLKTAKKLINKNLPKIHETFQVIYKYALTLKKMLKSIPYKKNEDTREVMIQCVGCHLHCVSNWNLPGPSGRLTKELAASSLL